MLTLFAAWLRTTDDDRQYWLRTELLLAALPREARFRANAGERADDGRTISQQSRHVVLKSRRKQRVNQPSGM